MHHDGAPAWSGLEQRPLLTGDLYRVPWGDDGASVAHHAQIHDLTDSLGGLTVGTAITWE